MLSLPLLINYLIVVADTSTEIEDEFLNNEDPTVAAPDLLDNAGGNDDIPEIPDVDSDEDSDFEEDEDEDPNKLWCICQQPHNNRFMICCDSCSGLYILWLFATIFGLFCEIWYFWTLPFSKHLSVTSSGNALGIWICGCRCILESSGSQNSGCT